MKISGWGGYPHPMEAKAFTLRDESRLPRFLPAPGGCIARGMGRGIGDGAMAERVILCRPFSCLLDFDEAEGVLTCESGVTLGEILETFLPRGWSPAVLPDTGAITVGGAIAGDVHGSNHHVAGCFSDQLLECTLMDADGRMHVCSPDNKADLFHATCGGMGLTGVILSARLRLLRVASFHIREKVAPVASLAELLSAFLEYADWPYLTGWIDCTAGKNRAHHGVFAAGRHDEEGGRPQPPSAPLPALPAIPFSLVNRGTIRLANALFLSSQARRGHERTTDIRRFCFPMDRFSGWNRLYGPRGFVRYQMAFPSSAAESGIARGFALLRRHGVPASRAALCRFGPANGNPLSFPLEGYGLTLDFAVFSGLFPVLEELDHLLRDHGGRLSLATDATMSPASLRQGYPDLDRFLELRSALGLSRVFQSRLSQRLGI